MDNVYKAVTKAKNQGQIVWKKLALDGFISWLFLWISARCLENQALELWMVLWINGSFWF